MPEPFIELNENLLSAWNAVSAGAVEKSRSGEPVCSIVLTDQSTRIAVCKDGLVTDTAALELGGTTLVVDSRNSVISISESGETFLDAVAKKILVGHILDEDMPQTLSNLIGETVVNAVCRRRPPQISMRLLGTEPLRQFWDVRNFLLCNLASVNRMSKMIIQSLQDSLEERDLICTRASCAPDEEINMELVRCHISNQS